MASLYDIGDQVVISGTFDNGVPAPVDPGTITLRIMAPSGPLAPLVYGVDPIVKDSTGRYHYLLSVTEAGLFTYRWEGTGANPGVYESSFVVRESVLA